jgi:hypothetical protein
MTTLTAGDQAADQTFGVYALSFCRRPAHPANVYRLELSFTGLIHKVTWPAQLHGWMLS